MAVATALLAGDWRDEEKPRYRAGGSTDCILEDRGGLGCMGGEQCDGLEVGFLSGHPHF